MTAGGNTARRDTWPEDLIGPVQKLPACKELWVALSGGLDSSLLLHVVAAVYPGVRALHINHQLQPNHDQTERACVELCKGLGVELEVRRVSVDTAVGSLEDSARAARYEVFKEVLQDDDLLLMAHHADDQAETVLFRLLRGTGVNGLAGMPTSRSLGRGHLYRPWLGVTRSRLEQVAREQGVSWTEDPSNQSEVHDRNYLRHSVMPGLKQRWPGLLKRVAHTARACAESEILSQRLAELQWQSCGDDKGRIRLAPFSALGQIERRNLVRWWIHGRGLPVPALSGWDSALDQLIHAGPDRSPEILGNGFCIRRYRDHLYLVAEVRIPEAPRSLLPGQLLKWGWWTLQLVPDSLSTTPESSCPEIRVSTRQGGERIRFGANLPSRSLKTWLQEQGVPPWERAALPLVCEVSAAGEAWIAIGDLWCSEQYSGGAHAAGWRLIVERDCD
ncbi:tRNA lysidine(34) synthetase TilS [Marinobacter sp. ST-43]|uniref:tRNA lysidine(34) synthetase TilS n=1 Tax=Marinobacter sp. ST-43 TaxID=3050453 RepID=UPI0026E0AFB6|nr:tRNA lysidine(34) synthetase TilS [Marinobacter sp. ST-43]